MANPILQLLALHDNAAEASLGRRKPCPLTTWVPFVVGGRIVRKFRARVNRTPALSPVHEFGKVDNFLSAARALHK
ncbi:MAG: hypothetical protein WA772_14130 [Candidatus Acidiferrales bacterium]